MSQSYLPTAKLVDIMEQIKNTKTIPDNSRKKAGT